jgi:hypothetical protein
MSSHEQLLGSRLYTAKLPAGRCLACGEIAIDYRALAAFELEVARDVAQNGPVSGETLAFMRRAIQMEAKTLANLLDVSPGTLSRWENALRDVDFPAWFVTGELVLEKVGQSVPPSERLSNVRADHVQPSRVRVDIDRAPRRSTRRIGAKS